jgi:hypothetical protein
MIKKSNILDEPKPGMLVTSWACVHCGSVWAKKSFGGPFIRRKREGE